MAYQKIASRGVTTFTFSFDPPTVLNHDITFRKKLVFLETQWEQNSMNVLFSQFELKLGPRDVKSCSLRYSNKFEKAFPLAFHMGGTRETPCIVSNAMQEI